MAPGEIHALLGENGAGKSTLMHMLYGMLRPDSGTIQVGGRSAAFATPHDAIAAGIGMIHQEFMQVASFTVAQNVAMGRRDTPFDLQATARRLTKLASRFGLDVDPGSRVEDLPIGVQQRVEILKLLDREARLLILDEPTAVLTPQEVAGFLDVLRALRATGRGIVLITHKLHEVMAVADRVTVLRDGRVAACLPVADTDGRALARLMVGRDTVLRVTKPPARAGAAVLRVERLTVADRAGRRRVDGVTFDVAPGEIFGMAGVDGNGQSELVEALFGLRRATSGQVVLAGEDITGWPPARRRAVRLGYLPADRRHTASVPGLSLADNAALGAHRRFARGGLWRNGRRAAADARDLVARFGVRGPGVQATVGQLSGGNLQKLVLGREIARHPRVLIVEQPTRGLDLGAIEAIWAELLGLRAAGCAIVLVSAELEELLNLADRIAVMFDGRLMGIVPAMAADAAAIGLLMAGHGTTTAT